MFDNNAEEAVNHYISIFKNSKLKSVLRNGEGGPGPKGSILTASFELEGQEFAALNGGPIFKFTEAILLVVNCENQAEVYTGYCSPQSPSAAFTISSSTSGDQPTGDPNWI